MKLYLTPAEKQLFAQLPQSIQDACSDVEVEYSEQYETAQELAMRMALVSYEDNPELIEALKKAGEQLEAGEWSDDEPPLADIPPTVLPRILFTIGTVGMSAFIEMLLVGDALTEDTIDGLQHLTEARHRLFEQNQAMREAVPA